MLLLLHANDRFHSVNRVAHKIFRDVRSQRGLVHGAIAAESSSPQVAPLAIVGIGGDTTTVGAGICGTNNECIAVYKHHVRGHDDDDDHDADAGH